MFAIFLDIIFRSIKLDKSLYSDSRYFNMPILDKTVKHFMTNNVQTIDASTTVFDAASLFFKTKKRRFPVINKDRLVGQLSRKDIVIAALNMKSQTWR